ncbi:hypothetical protein [Proteus sp. G2673]|uniref:hypothetical protein n=1 Tax=Proteus sp. G2673 TaxID=2698885 RepID=UPI00137910AB|nr:hypothetical protein [Proteus sp. G2673]NBL88872.1 hypothetical protein [Proteus sp. G2673]
MSDNQKYTAIKIRTLCTACGNDCGEHLITVGENIILCFTCIDKTKEKVDLYRKEIAEKEIKDMARLIEAHALKNDSAYISRFLYQAGYRKVE